MSNIYTYNGSAIVAMAGKECVCIGSDLRFGVQLQALSGDFQKVYKIHDRLFIGLGGLATDAQTFQARLKFLVNMYNLQEEKDISPRAFAYMVSSELYSKRFGSYFISPVIAGVEEDGTPFVCSCDSIGALSISKDFEVGGSAATQIQGLCERLHDKNMPPKELFLNTAQCLLGGCERDAASGFGGTLYLITKSGYTAKTLKARMD